MGKISAFVFRSVFTIFSLFSVGVVGWVEKFSKFGKIKFLILMFNFIPKVDGAVDPMTGLLSDLLSI